MQIETHPHTPFVPHPLNALIMGSFPGRATTLSNDPQNQWFYSAKRNQLWKILENVFNTPLPDRTTKAAVLTRYGIGIGDLFLQAKRRKASNADQDLEIITYNDKAIAAILQQYPKVQICFTSRFVEKHFKALFADYPHTCLLPSPSPRYARLNVAQKAEIYRECLLQRTDL